MSRLRIGGETNPQAPSFGLSTPFALSTEFGTITNDWVIFPAREVHAILVITRIPTHRNDGSKVGRRELRNILNRVCNAFGGYTLEGPFHGAWIADDGQRYEETSYRLEVVVPAEQVKDARQLFMEIGVQLGQRAIYFEVRDGGEIIELE